MKYTIVHINNRSKQNMDRTKSLLSNFEYVDDIEFCDGKKIDARKIIEDMGISINWNPYDGRTHPPLDGELGLCISNINIYKYIVKNSIGEILVLEDDAIISEDFLYYLREILSEVPQKWDFISLHYNEPHNHEDQKTNINLKYLHRSINQYSSTVAMLYSFAGAKKILRLLKAEGIQYTVDCQLYKKSLEEKLNGYSLKRAYSIVSHDINVKSTVDILGVRWLK